MLSLLELLNSLSLLQQPYGISVAHLILMEVDLLLKDFTGS